MLLFFWFLGFLLSVLLIICLWTLFNPYGAQTWAEDLGISDPGAELFRLDFPTEEINAYLKYRDDYYEKKINEGLVAAPSASLSEAAYEEMLMKSLRAHLKEPEVKVLNALLTKWCLRVVRCVMNSPTKMNEKHLYDKQILSEESWARVCEHTSMLNAQFEQIELQHKWLYPTLKPNHVLNVAQELVQEQQLREVKAEIEQATKEKREKEAETAMKDLIAEEDRAEARRRKS